MSNKIEKAAAAVKEAEAATAAARERVRIAHLSLRKMRTGLQIAIASWQAAFPVITREQLVRAEAAADMQRRLDIAEGRLPPEAVARVGDSAVDRIAQFRGDGGFRRGAGKYRRFRGQRLPLPSGG
jgi:hypothetical protein